MKSQHLIEILTPRQSAEDLDGELTKFAERYHKILENDYVVSVPDNPMGVLHFQLTEVVKELNLPFPEGQVLVHINTFHTREHLDELLRMAAEMGARHLLLISGDGSERLPKLEPESIGMKGNSVTSVELLRYVHREYPGKFTCGVAFNPYEPQDHEMEKLRRKIDAGASYIITQPIIGREERLEPLRSIGLPVTVGAWMSKRIDLLASCIGYELKDQAVYDPLENLKTLCEHYPAWGTYLALVGFKTQLPAINALLHEIDAHSH